jgi:uncharacterized protein with GYD domain
MAKYLFLASYTPEGLRGLLKDGGTRRKEDLGEMVKELNGKLESIHFAFGENDVYSIVEVPDNVSAATIALKINASGAAKVNTVVLLTPEQIDEAARINVGYRPPGQ